MESLSQAFQAFSENILLLIIAFLIALIAVIGVHEAGHYLAARLFGVRIDKFSLGFGKEIAGFTSKSGTRWSLSRIPLGGYVAIFGDVDPEKPEIWDRGKNKKRRLTKKEMEVAFFTRPVWQRMLIVLAGPFANFLFAIVLFSILFATQGQVSTPPVVTMVGKNTAAYEAGFKPLDVILAIDDTPIERFEEVWDRTFENPGVSYKFTIRRGDRVMDIHAAAHPINYKDEKGVWRSHGRLGAIYLVALKLSDLTSVAGVDVRENPDKARALIVKNIGKRIDIGFAFDYDKNEDLFSAIPSRGSNEGLFDPHHVDYDKPVFYDYKSKKPLCHRFGPGEAVLTASRETLRMLDEGLKVMGVLLTGGGPKDQPALAGVAKIGDAAGRAIQSSWYAFLVFMAAFSVQIGFINLFPVPVLDGGYLVFLAYEAAFRRPVPARIKDALLYLGLAFLFGIMIIANVSDIFQLTR